MLSIRRHDLICLQASLLPVYGMPYMANADCSSIGCDVQVGKPTVSILRIMEGLKMMAKCSPETISLDPCEMVFGAEDGISPICRTIISNNVTMLTLLLSFTLNVPLRSGFKVARIKSGRCSLCTCPSGWLPRLAPHEHATLPLSLQAPVLCRNF